LLVRLALATGFTILTAACSLIRSMARRPAKNFAVAVVAVALLSTAAFAWGNNKDESLRLRMSTPARFAESLRHVMITIATNTDRKAVIGGRNWLEWDRFDVIAKIPPAPNYRP
jgi:hypothetical protein